MNGEIMRTIQCFIVSCVIHFIRLLLAINDRRIFNRIKLHILCSKFFAID